MSKRGKVINLRTQHRGYIYIVDISMLEENCGWMLTAVLLHQQAFIDDVLKYPQITSAARFKIKLSTLHDHALLIQQALYEGRRVHAEVLFNNLKLIVNKESNDLPNTEAELVEFNQVIVEYGRRT